MKWFTLFTERHEQATSEVTEVTEDIQEATRTSEPDEQGTVKMSGE